MWLRDPVTGDHPKPLLQRSPSEGPSESSAGSEPLVLPSHAWLPVSVLPGGQGGTQHVGMESGLCVCVGGWLPALDNVTPWHGEWARVAGPCACGMRPPEVRVDVEACVEPLGAAGPVRGGSGSPGVLSPGGVACAARFNLYLGEICKSPPEPRGDLPSSARAGEAAKGGA